mgnify:CR=1 FL=1
MYVRRYMTFFLISYPLTTYLSIGYIFCCIFGDAVMKSDCFIRQIRQEEIAEALGLVWKVFLEFESPDYTKEGVEEFYKSIHDETYLSKLC